jgi:hypothetical protein
MTKRPACRQVALRGDQSNELPRFIFSHRRRASAARRKISNDRGSDQRRSARLKSCSLWRDENERHVMKMLDRL